ncbi:MAG: hypothetical protein OXU36_10570 [Candidatus Poribacteria bacterium]|nr:hypothetical protein [Candidatus Poribacteria bacterium]
MAGIRSSDMRLIVGQKEFSNVLSQLSMDTSISELDDSVAQTRDMEYLPEMVSSTLSASGRWTGDPNEINRYIKSTLHEATLIAGSLDGKNYELGKFIRTAQSNPVSLGSRVNATFGVRLAEGELIDAREVFRHKFSAGGTFTGDVIDLGAAIASKAHKIYVYYFPSGNTTPGSTQIKIQHATARGGAYGDADSHTFNVTALSKTDPAEDEATYSLQRYMRVQAIVSGASKAGEIVVLMTETY